MTTLRPYITKNSKLKNDAQKEKQNIIIAIESWKGLFQSSDSSQDIKADESIKSAKLFADNFYFECAVTRASKQIVENIKKASKEAKRTEQMETEFTPNEQSIHDMKFQSSARLTRQEKQLNRSVEVPKAVVRTDLLQRMGNIAVETQVRMPATRITPHPLLKAHKGDKVDLNNGEAQVPQENQVQVSLLANLPLLLVAANNKKTEEATETEP